MFVNVKELVQQNKWQVEMRNIGEKEWQSYFSTIQRLNEVKLRDFQYKIKNKIIVTNSFMFKINKTDNEMCSYCQEQPEKNQKKSFSKMSQNQNILYRLTIMA